MHVFYRQIRGAGPWVEDGFVCAIIKTMKGLQHTVKAFIRKGEEYYIAECHELPVVTQGGTLDEAVENLREAVALHLEGEDLEELGLAPNPTLIITLEAEPLISAA